LYGSEYRRMRKADMGKMFDIMAQQTRLEKTRFKKFF